MNIDLLCKQTDRLINSKEMLYIWETQLQKKFPMLYEVIIVILSIPSSQASVERSFSSLKFVFSDRRQNIDLKLL